MNPVSWTWKRGFYMTKLSYEDKININLEKKQEKAYDKVRHIFSTYKKLLKKKLNKRRITSAIL